MFGKSISKSSFNGQIMTVLLLPLVLSGCMATMILHGNAKKDIKTTTVHLSDTITHIGTPKTPIHGYPHALVMVGDKQSYLLTSPNINRPSLLKDIFTQVDTAYLYVKPYAGVSSSEHIKKSTNYYQIDVAQNYCYAKENKLCDTVWLYYEKPTTKLAKNEKSMMEGLGFMCHVSDDKQHLMCSQEVGIHLHLAGKIPSHNLPHRLKQPIEFRAIEEHRHSKKNTGLMLLTPVAVGIDVVTFPLQFLWAVHGLKSK